MLMVLGPKSMVNTMKIIHTLKAFFEWWPDITKTLQEIRVTGGEPA